MDKNEVTYHAEKGIEKGWLAVPVLYFSLILCAVALKIVIGAVS